MVMDAAKQAAALQSMAASHAEAMAEAAEDSAEANALGAADGGGGAGGGSGGVAGELGSMRWLDQADIDLLMTEPHVQRAIANIAARPDRLEQCASAALSHSPRPN